MLAKDRERVVAEVSERVVEKIGDDPARIEQVILDTIYHERLRLEREHNRKGARKQRAYYDKLYRAATQSSQAHQVRLMRRLINGFADEVAGRFDPRFYRVATRVVPSALSVLLNTLSPLRLLEALPSGLATLDEHVEVLGEVDALKAAVDRGTTILAPTHSSNLDSIVLGFSIYQLGLPPYIYGAGLNLFSNKVLGFFMGNLGAYKVDRRKKAALYKDVLKTFAGCTLETGYHNLFFPGGTRSRSGKVEKKLKLGLLSRGLDAYIHNLTSSKDRPDIFVVPVTINYQLVLEAETLIDDFLKEAGKSRFIIEDDEFSKPKLVLDFLSKLMALNSRIQLVVSRPLDVFGNLVDDDGQSLDTQGRTVDRTRYVVRDGAPTFDAQRDAEYARCLASSVGTAYQSDTVLNSTNVVSFAVHRMMLRENQGVDLYKLLHTGGAREHFPLTEVYRELEALLGQLRTIAARGEVRLDQAVARGDSVAVLSEALAHLASFHRTPALERRGDTLHHQDRKLVLFYQHRLDGLSLSRELG